MPDDILFRFRNLAPISWDNVVNLIDILVVSYLIYRLLLIVRNARAWKIFMGIFMFVAVLFLSDVLGLRTLHWILDKATALGPVALVILLLPELRQALEGLGRFGGSLPNRLATSAGTTQTGTIDAIVASAGEMAAARIGAIIVIERTTHLNDIADNGVRLDAALSSSLITSIFYGENPLHDGALIIRGDRAVAAACQLPLSENTKISPHLHMRHRAGIGVSEHSDSVVVIISEERGQITVAISGQITPCETPHRLQELLLKEIGPSENGRSTKRRREGDSKDVA